MLGFVCHLKATDQVLLLTNLHSKAAAAQLEQHPALALLLQQPGRVAGVLHLAGPGVAGSRALRLLCQRLRPAADAAGGQQLLLERPPPHGSSQVCAAGCHSPVLRPRRAGIVTVRLRGVQSPAGDGQRRSGHSG